MVEDNNLDFKFAQRAFELTTSSDEKDIEDCYESGVCGYIQKPARFEELVKAIEVVKDYWFELVHLPNME